jgi:Flp pilus assembly protein TadD
LEKLLEEEPSDPVVRNNLASALLTKGNLPRAEQLLTDSCRLRPSGPQLYALGVVRLNLHRAESAEEALRQAIQLAPDAAGYHFAHGSALQHLGNRQEAISEYRRELEVDPANEQARQALAQLAP